MAELMGQGAETGIGVAEAGGDLGAGKALNEEGTQGFVYLFFYGFFLFHEVRDEAVIYQNCKAVRSPELLDPFSLAVGLSFVTLLTAGYALFLTCGPRGVRFPAGLWLVAGALAVTCAWSMHRFLRLGRGGLSCFLAEHRPLVVVYASLLLVLALSAPLGSIGFIVLVHVASWLVFVRARLQGRQAPASHPWAWLRSTPTGFLVLHLGLALVLLVLMGARVRVHVFRRVGFLSEALAGRNFCYWALIWAWFNRPSGLGNTFGQGRGVWPCRTVPCASTSDNVVTLG